MQCLSSKLLVCCIFIDANESLAMVVYFFQNTTSYLQQPSTPSVQASYSPFHLTLTLLLLLPLHLLLLLCPFPLTPMSLLCGNHFIKVGPKVRRQYILLHDTFPKLSPFLNILATVACLRMVFSWQGFDELSLGEIEVL